MYKDLLNKRDLGKPIISFCKSLDTLMGGGIPIGQIVRILIFNYSSTQDIKINTIYACI